MWYVVWDDFATVDGIIRAGEYALTGCNEKSALAIAKTLNEEWGTTAHRAEYREFA